MKLRNRPELRDVSGGRAIELLAEEGDSKKFEFPLPLVTDQSCNFSWAGLRSMCHKYITECELKHGNNLFIKY